VPGAFSAGTLSWDANPVLALDRLQSFCAAIGGEATKRNYEMLDNLNKPLWQCQRLKASME